MKGKLFLAAEGKHPDSLAKLKDFVGKDFSTLDVVYIPTAANGDGWGHWKESETLPIVKKLFKSVKIVELEHIGRDKSIEDVIGKPDILWMAGGMAGYLMYWVRRTKLDKYLPSLLQSGTIYVGSSAGSMICSKTDYLSEFFPDEEEIGSSYIPGLGYLDFEIFPHYEEQYAKLLKDWKHDKLCLLKNGDVITLDDGKIAFLGEERYTTI